MYTRTYVVIFFNTAVISPMELQDWLNKQYQEEGLKFVATAGEYFIFKDMRLERRVLNRGQD